MNVELKANKKEIQRLTRTFKVNQLKIKKNFFEKKNGVVSCKLNSKNVDFLISELYKKVNKKLNGITKNLIVCAVGGYGRKQLAPYSDIDLLFIHNDFDNNDKLEKSIQFILYPLWDLGFNVGHATRSIKQASEFSKKDHTVRTSMLDARLICGSKTHFKKVIKVFKKDVTKKSKSFFKEKILERERKLLDINFNFIRNEPDIKQSAGSIRDINLISWGLKIFCIVQNSEEEEFLTKNEKKKLTRSLNFFLTIRCFLHYLSNRSNDKLSFDYQKMIADRIQRKSLKGVNSNVEILMNKYFYHTRSTKSFTQIVIKIIYEYIANKAHKISNKININVNNYSFVEDFIENFHRGKISIFYQRILFEKINLIPQSFFVSKKFLRFFKKSLVSSNKKETLLLLNDLGIISKVIPDFSKIVSQTQFDRFHSLTVDQHTLRAINILKDIKLNPKKKGYALAGKIFKKKFDKKPLFYATLLHDIAKGRGGKHESLGSAISKKILKTLHEDEATIKKVSWLVENHFLLSEYAFKKDIQDYSVIKKITSKIKNIRELDSLYLLTVADISAVDQGIWNDWKAMLLEEIYQKCEEEILKPPEFETLNKKINKVKKSVFMTSKISNKKINDFSKITYPNFWLLQTPKTIAFQIEKFFQGIEKKKDFNFSIIKKEKIIELTIVTNDRPKLFLDIISIFVSEKVSVLEARIFTLDDNSVIDTFKISLDGSDYLEKKEIESKIDKLKIKLENFGNDKFLDINNDLLLQKNIHQKIEISLDNTTSSTYSILVVVTNNRPRLLYDISKILIKNELIISTAKISTNGDFIEDSFYLRNKFGFKLRDGEFSDNLIKEIKLSLTKVPENVF
ncbi:MAG: Bifunctional uridylyltransferase/uridylyl-removing enzyme [Alphaproteobacteria bacterium MarineAlpha8_Bin1]|nr:MAG: Bifunctional uridylyltransferase/uridylyl-removing enzyme [Alphaproteobacteria bacterium MarineAlpha8_Bin1]|tara:strand:- start:586 stop:3138 length:2553 start_codon:yes stop_codon:yes gene_type:complete